MEKYLYSYYNLSRHKRQVEYELSDAMAEYHSLSNRMLVNNRQHSVKISKTNKVQDPVFAAAVQTVEIYQTKILMLKTELSDVIDKQQKIKRFIRSLNLSEKEYLYITYRYFKALPSFQIAIKMNYSERQVRRFRTSAISKLQIRMQKECANEIFAAV